MILMMILEVPDGSGRTFSCDSGFTAMMRSQMWEAKDSLVGQHCTVKYFEVGMQENIPRFPIFKGLRWKGDM